MEGNLKGGHKVEMFGSSDLLVDVVELKFPHCFVMLLGPPGSDSFVLSIARHQLSPLLKSLIFSMILASPSRCRDFHFISIN